jgi:hypothetical protein
MGKISGGLLILLVLFSPLIYVWVWVMPLVWQGDGALMNAYEQESLGKRYIEYNKAVDFYLRAEKRSPLLFRDWMLAERTGDALFALRDYPQAAFYFWTAYLDHPGKETREKLTATLQRLHSDEVPHAGLGIAPSYVIFAILCGVLGMLFAIIRSWKRSAALLGILSLIGFVYLAGLRYFSPVEAILVNDQGFKAVPRGESLMTLPAGSKVSVIEVIDQDAKIRTSNGAIGYVSDKAIRVLR